MQNTISPVILIFIFSLAGCTGIPDGLQVVDDFDINRYLGKWYEIARLDHRFERGLTGVTAEYSLRSDGGIKVVNSGYTVDSGELKRAEGRAYLNGKKNVGSLKVSFFGPFYSGYHIISLDKEAYQYAMVTGPDRDYLWILARAPILDAAVLDGLLKQARQSGFEVDKLIYP